MQEVIYKRFVFSSLLQADSVSRYAADVFSLENKEFRLKRATNIKGKESVAR